MKVQIELPDRVWGRLVDLADERRTKVPDLIADAVAGLIPTAEEDRKKVRELWELGLMDAEIARELNWTNKRVATRRREMDLLPRRPKKTKEAA